MATTPKSALATLRPDLGMAMLEIDLIAVINSLVGLELMPRLDVDEAAGNWGKIPTEELLKSADDTRAPGGRYNQADEKLEPATYACTEHGIEKAIDDRQAKMYANYFDSEAIAAMRAQYIVLNNLETRIVTKALAVTNTASAAVDWGTSASAKPMNDMISWQKIFFGLTGRFANAFCLSRLKFNISINAQSLIDRMKTSGFSDAAMQGDPNAVKMNERSFAQALNIPKLVVAGAPSNTANEGAAAVAGAPTIASKWNDRYGLLYYRPTSIDVQEPCWGRTLHYSEDGSTLGQGIETYRDESRRSNMARCRCDTDEHVMYPEMALLVDLGATINY